MRNRVCLGLAAGLFLVLSGSAAPRAATGGVPIVQAAMQDDREAVRMLVKSGADVSAAEGDGMTALHWAASKGDADIARLLLAAHANVQAPTRIAGHTPLHLAASNGQAAIAVMLLDAGANANAVTTAGTTPLMLAAASGDAAIVRALAGHGANVNAAELAKGHTALMFAAAANKAAATTALIEAGADTKAMTKVFSLMTVVIPPDKSALNNYDQKLRAASRAPQEKKPVAGVDRNYEYNELVAAQGGMTPLLFAARQGRLEAVKALLDGGADIDQVSGGVSISPLTIAIVNGHFDLAMYMLGRGANPSLAAENGMAPLYATLNCRWSDEVEYPQPQSYLQQKTTHLELLTMLLEKGANPNARLTKKIWYSGYARDNSGVDERGSTPFWRAAYAADVEALRILKAHGADPTIGTLSPPGRQNAANAQSGQNAQNAGGPGALPLHAATGVGFLQNYAGNGHRMHPGGWMRTVKYLVEELGADVNAKDHDQNSPLHYAAARGDNEMIMYLISKGADVTAVNRAGLTTVDAANGPHQRVQPFPETIKLLEELGAKNNHRCVSC